MTKHNRVVPVYFNSLELENVRCFGERQCLSLTEGGRPARWTLILGDNGVGKTTLLQCLTGMLPTPEGIQKRPKDKWVGFALQNEENPVFESLIRVGTRGKVTLAESVSVNQRLSPLATSGKPTELRSTIVSIAVELRTTNKRKLKDVVIRPKRRQTIRKAFGGVFPDPLVVTYGANRQLGKQNLRNDQLGNANAHAFTRLKHVTELYDAAQILADLDYASQKDSKSRRHLECFKAAIAQVLPGDDYKPDHIKIYPPDLLSRDKRSGVYLKTRFGLVRLSDLSLGYQTMLAWTTDLAWRLLQRYPRSANPLAQPAVVLIDEIDLHLHPLWQLTIIDSLSELFPGTQFVATAHSPLIVQVAETANLVLLREQDSNVVIVNDPDIVRSWRVDQILTSELFGVAHARNRSTQLLFARRDELARKRKRTAAEEIALSQINSAILELPTSDDGHVDRVMSEFIREAEALLQKRQEIKT
jgi:energy-coupling factor transporter ATP-binding protein EcfA2